MKFLTLVIFSLCSTLSVADDVISDKEIKMILIGQSIQAYGKSCPCPYSKSPNGGQCGLNSAYSTTSRLTILCYPSNVTETMVKKYRIENGVQ
jgi:hypothetical protein